MSEFIPLSSSSPSSSGGGDGSGRGNDKRGRGGRHHHHHHHRGGGGGGRGVNRKRGRGRGGRHHFNQHSNQRHRGHGRGRGGHGGRHFASIRNNDQEETIDISGIEEIESATPLNSPSSTNQKQKRRYIRIAIQGCSHGALQQIYSTLQRYHKTKTPNKQPIDLLLCCGDFQSLRNKRDFRSMAVPKKYRSMGTFYKYYSRTLEAPVTTVFVGGNHEASNYLQELYYGGWVAPNMYYLGAAGCINVSLSSSSSTSGDDTKLRIAGLSGIYKSYHYTKGRFEVPPYNDSTVRSVYHVRNVDVHRLKQLHKNKNKIDIMLSHDWPRGVEQHGDTQKLIKRKKFFKQEIDDNTLGSPPCRELLFALKPSWWFAAHLHVKFSASVIHHVAAGDDKKDNERKDEGCSRLVPSQVLKTKKVIHKTDTKATVATDSTPHQNSENNNKSEKTHSSPQEQSTSFVGLESSSTSCNDYTSIPDLTEQMTKFLSLDKCLPRRRHLQIINIPFYDDDDDDDDVGEGDDDDGHGDGENEESYDRVDEMKDAKEEEHGNDKEQNGDDTKDPEENEKESNSAMNANPKKQDGNNNNNNNNENKKQQQQQQKHQKVQLEYDLEWLAILQKTHYLTCNKNQSVSLPRDEEEIFVSKKDTEDIKQRLLHHRLMMKKKQQQHEKETSTTQNTINPLVIPQNFVMTVPPHNDGNDYKEEENDSFHDDNKSGTMVGNPQTDELLNILQLDHIVTVPYNRNSQERKKENKKEDESMNVSMECHVDSNEIDLDVDDDDDEDDGEMNNEEEDFGAASRDNNENNLVGKNYTNNNDDKVKESIADIAVDDQNEIDIDEDEGNNANNCQDEDEEEEEEEEKDLDKMKCISIGTDSNDVESDDAASQAKKKPRTG